MVEGSYPVTTLRYLRPLSMVFLRYSLSEASWAYMAFWFAR